MAESGRISLSNSCSISLIDGGNNGQRETHSRHPRRAEQDRSATPQREPTVARVAGGDQRATGAYVLPEAQEAQEQGAIGEAA
jgi:hypothetical protein